MGKRKHNEAVSFSVRKTISVVCADEAQRSKSLGAPSRYEFWEPQEGCRTEKIYLRRVRPSPSLPSANPPLPRGEASVSFTVTMLPTAEANVQALSVHGTTLHGEIQKIYRKKIRTRLPVSCQVYALFSKHGVNNLTPLLVAPRANIFRTDYCSVFVKKIGGRHGVNGVKLCLVE